jgi:Protein tyrosine/serine phosphatase
MRKVELAGAFNVRDLGGYQSRLGRETRRGKLYRADGLNRLSEEDIQKLAALKINLDIDLRSDEEIKKWPDKIIELSGLSYEKVSLLPSVDATELPKSLGELYLYMLDHSQAEFLRIFQLIAKNADGVTLFHCSAGKDRTGLVAALLLLLVGVEERFVVQDYTESQENLRPMLKVFAEMNDPALAAYLTSRPEDIAPFLEKLQAEYKGAEGYLCHLGVTRDEIGRLRGILL